MDKRPARLVDGALIAKDSILLAFDEQDAEIARNWQKGPETRIAFHPRPRPI